MCVCVCVCTYGCLHLKRRPVIVTTAAKRAGTKASIYLYK